MDPGLFLEKSWSERLRVVFWVVIILGTILVIWIVIGGNKLLIRTSDGYQAVFLDNGQVYFGRLKAVNRDFLSLTDIYYLRAGSSLQPTTAGSPQAGVDLVKLGAELHGPRDEMIINREHVLFYEDITESGQVMQLIRKHKGIE